MTRIFARIAVRESEAADQAMHLILGLTHRAVFKPGHIYEIVEILGEHIIRDLGPSAATGDPHPRGVTWHRDANSLINEGHHLRTIQEYAYLTSARCICSNCHHPGEHHDLEFQCLFGSGYFAEPVEKD